MANTVIRTYIADDHEMVREGLVALVADDDTIEIVGQCGDGLTAVSEVSELKPDVAVIDIRMPGLNGLDVCRELRRKASKTAILILTMHTNEQFISNAIKYGASGYLMKDAAPENFREAIRTVARNEMFLGPGVPASALACDNGEDIYDSLTSRERQVLQMIAEGNTSRQIAEYLKLSPKTVDTHRTRLMRKLSLHDQTALVKYALRKGIIDLN